MANLVWIVPAWIAVGALLAAAGWTYARLTKRQARQTIRRLEHLANHPGARALLDDIRKEDTP
jgi:hypothetical protein